MTESDGFDGVWGYRVVAKLTTGGEALVCVAETRWQAAVLARGRAKALPDGTLGLRLEWWSGRPGAGRWVGQWTAAGELPAPPPVKKRRPRKPAA